MSDGDRTAIKIDLKADFLRSDLEKGLVWFVNYAAIDPTAVRAEDLDLHGAGMLPEHVEMFAHRWLAYSRSVDINHDGIGRPVHVIESFFNSMDVQSAAWPLNSHACRFDVSQSGEAMEGLKKGDLNCVSLDAFTFNKVRRLPAAEAKSVLGIPDGRPDSPAELAREVARLGYPGVTGVRRLQSGLYLCERDDALPVAVAMADGGVDVTPAAGAWGRVAASLMTSGTLTAAQRAELDVEAYVPDHGDESFDVDHAPWDPSEIAKLLSDIGFNMNGNDPISPFAFVTGLEGKLAHHVPRGGAMMVSLAGVDDALARLDEVPEAHRESARQHLLAHKREAA